MATTEPRIIYVFDVKSWYETMSPLTKLDVIDIAPIVSGQFYFDSNLNAYVLVLVKSKWDLLTPELKKRFMFISRRVKEEMEVPMSTLDREKYENSDIFELVMSERQQLPSVTEGEEASDPTVEDLMESINAVELA